MNKEIIRYLTHYKNNVGRFEESLELQTLIGNINEEKTASEIGILFKAAIKSVGYDDYELYHFVIRKLTDILTLIFDVQSMIAIKPK